MDEADAVVTYNGNRFDIPTLQREFLLSGLPPPSPSKSIDLYRTVKRQFRFASNKLDFVCQQLGLGSKTHHKGMDLWTGVEAGDAASRKTMTTYNKQDVFLLEKLYNRLLPWIPNHPNVSLYNNLTEKACTNCGSVNVQKRGLSHSKIATYQRYQCSDCGGWSRERVADKTIDRRHLLVRDNGGA
jgi:DNA polymerase elongation subunit (family B)